MQLRKKIIAGNWKMNKTPNEAAELVSLLKSKVNSAEVDVVFCVPDLDVHVVNEMLKDSKIALGAQNMHFEKSGAFTGESSASMLVESGIKYVIIGHSERRMYFAETDETVNKKVKRALECGLIPIMCVGESLEQRELGITFEFVRMQIKAGLSEIEAADVEKLVIAYEPIWAIGTGKTATSEQAEEVCAQIRKVIGELYGIAVSDKVRIQYGGSVNATNAAELFAMPNIDGGLVGGASLKDEFASIVNYKS